MQGPDQNHVMGKWYLANRVTRVWRRDCVNYSCGYYELYQG